MGKRGNTKIEIILAETHNLEKPISVICAATIDWGKAGILDDVKHLSLFSVRNQMTLKDFFQSLQVY